MAGVLLANTSRGGMSYRIPMTSSPRDRSSDRAIRHVWGPHEEMMRDPGYFVLHANRKQTSGEGKTLERITNPSGEGTANNIKENLYLLNQ